jgi:phage host-nuclease inhibitor protein Gam
LNAIANLKDPHVAMLAQQIRDLCGDDDLAFIDTLDGASNAVEAAREVVRFIAATEAMEIAAKSLSERYKARADDFASRIERARNALVQFMGEIGEKTMVLPEGTITRKASAEKVIGEGNPDTMAEEFVRTKTHRELDKTAIKNALKQGVDVPGFCLSNGAETLQVRPSWKTVRE